MNEPERVVIIGPSARFLSGISYYTMRLSNALSRRTSVLALQFRHMLPRRLFPGWKRVGDSLSTAGFEKEVQVRELLDWYDPLSWIKASKMARSCDVAIFEWWTSSVAHMYVALQVLLSRRMPVIIEYHEVVDPLEQSIMPIRIYSRVMGSVVRRLADHYIVHSSADRDLVRRMYRVPPEKITVIPHPLYDQYPVLEKSAARRALAIGEENVILFFGLLRPYKGVKYLILAFNDLPPDLVRSTRLMIVGEAWEDRESLGLAGESPNHDRITVVDRYISDDEIPKYFSAADMVVLPYTRASQSGVAHIAMAYGLPVIATRVGGLEEGLRGYRGSFFIEGESPGAIREQIIRCIQGKKVFPVPEHLRWDRIGEAWIAVCSGLLPHRQA